MSKFTHTQEPWECHGNTDPEFVQRTSLIIQTRPHGHNIARVIPCFGMTAAEVDANAKRIVACVNACKFVPNEWLQANSVNALIEKNIENERRDASNITSLMIDHDLLLEALKEIADLHPKDFKGGREEAYAKAREIALEAINSGTEL